MESQTVNGGDHTAQVVEEKSVTFESNNNKGETIIETHVTHAEVNHNTEEEPTVPKRNVFPETEEEKPSTEVNEENETTAVEVNTTEEPIGAESTESEPQTSENFIKIEERKTIERLSRVIDTELNIESIRVDTHSEVTESQSELEESKPQPEESAQVTEETAPVPEETAPVPEESAPVLEESAPVPEITTTQASEPVVTDEADDESVNRFQVSLSHEGDNTPKTEETNDEVRTEEVHENNVQNNHDNGETFKTEAEERHNTVNEDVIIKQNGRKTVYSSEEDLNEEEDQLPEFTGFKNKLKLWSNGKPSAEESTDASPVDKRDKFKTLRQIRKGNTRSLMERFQTQS